MADITANLDAWSSTEGSNSPSGSTTIGTGLDDNLRAVQAGAVLWVERFPYIHNLALEASVAASALTITLSGKDSADPSATNKVRIPFRNVTVGTGDFTQVVVSAATTLTISSGSTMGATSATAFRLWIVGFNDGGTFRLGAINCLSGKSIYPLTAWGIASSTTEGGAGGADSAQVFYTGTGVTSKAYTVLGYMSWETGLTAAGTWDAVPTRIQLFGNGVPLPGQSVAVNATTFSTFTNSNTAIPTDNSIPQSGEGVELVTSAVTASSASNLLRARFSGYFYNEAGAAANLVVALFRDAVADAKAAVAESNVDQSLSSVSLEFSELAGASGSTTYKIRFGPSAAAGSGFNANGGASANLFGGVDASTLTVEEVMA
jgi:hypothetical protein